MEYDAIIVGARCAGAATALLLARAGHRVLLVDRGQPGTDTLSTHALMRGAVVQLHKWGVLADVMTAGTPPVRRATFFYGDESISVPVKPRDGIDALYAPRRHLLDRLLVDAARTAGADVAFGVRVKDLLGADRGRVTGVLIEHESGQLDRVGARIVVGADGLGSTVARLVGAPVHRESQHASSTMYGYWNDLAVDGYEWYYAPGLSAGVVPTNERQTCVFLSIPHETFINRFTHAQSQAESFRQLLSEVAPAFAGRIRKNAPVRLRGFGGHRGFLRQASGAGWALVGDAGYFKDPMTAHGITDALRDAELLALAIDAGSDAALADYQASRDEASLRLFEITDQIASFHWTMASLRTLHEALAEIMSAETRQLLKREGPRTRSRAELYSGPLAVWPKPSASTTTVFNSTPASSGVGETRSG